MIDTLLPCSYCGAPQATAPTGPAPDCFRCGLALGDPAPRFPHVPPTLRRSSVPTVLIGLGALCLLVAASTFLAVAWSFLGVGGRTVVLVSLTTAALVAGGVLGGRRLRVAAEALTTVGLGLVGLDVLGARSAGWLGAPGVPGVPGTVAVLGGALGAVAVALTLRPTTEPRVVAPQVAVPVGVSLLLGGLAGAEGHARELAALAVLSLVLVSVAARRLEAAAASTGALVGAAAWWTGLTVAGVVEVAQHPTVDALARHGHGLGVLLAAGLALLPMLPVLPGVRPPGVGDLRLASVMVAGMLLSLLAVAPVQGETPTALTATFIGLTLAWAAVTTRVGTEDRLLPLTPTALAAIPVATVALDLLGQALVQLVGDRPVFGATAGLTLTPAKPYADPLLLVPCVLTLLAAVLALPAAARPPRTPWLRAAAVAVLVAGVATLALEDRRLWLLLTVLALGAAVTVVDGLRRREPGSPGLQVVVGLALATLAVVAARPSDVLSALTAAVLVALLTAATWRYDGVVELDASLPIALGWLLWATGAVAGLPTPGRAVPVLVVLGLLAARRPRPATESTAWAVTAVAATVAISASTDPAFGVALHLTLAGVLVTLSALVNPQRRDLARVGAALLALGTWVRLAELGVHAPEPYTLPGAVALTLVGVVRMRRSEVDSATALRPGLVLGTLPSLLWVLATDPVTPRAALLGAACLVLVIGGAQLGWNAPLVIGAAVGTALVLWELAPYAAVTPQWVLLGLAGTLLTVVGITWERRARDVQQASHYLARLR